VRITSTGEIVTGGLTSSTGQLHLYKADATGGKLVLQSQVASDATAKISMLSRLLDNSNKTAYIEAYRGNINFGGESGYGKVGIGTASPTGRLSVALANSSTPQFRLESPTSDVDFAISNYNDSAGTYVSLGVNHNFNSSGNDAVMDTNKKSSAIVLDGRNNGRIQFLTGSTGIAAPRMTVMQDGKVGIGTDNPTMGKLQVTGPKYVITNSGKALGGIHVSPDSGAVTGEFGGAISLSAGGNGSSAIAAVNDGGSDNDSTGLAFFVHSSGTGADDATEVVRIDQIGNVGIGNTDPSCPLEVGNGSSTYVKIRNASSGDVSSGYNIMSGSTTTTSLYGNAGEGWTTLMSGGSLGFRVNQAVSGFNPMNIDTSGRVTTPSQPGFLARGNTSQWIQGATSSWSTIVAGIAHSNGSTIGVNLTEGSSNHWNGYDTGSDFNTGTGTFTAPVEGKYQIHGSLYASKVGTTASDYMHFLVYVNGQQVNQIYTMKGHNAAYAHDFSMNLSTILFLEASDYVQWKIYTTSSNMRVYGDHMSIGAHLLG
jgi:hypothetical protein